jgi:hypothetical protein
MYGGGSPLHSRREVGLFLNKATNILRFFPILETCHVKGAARPVMLREQSVLSHNIIHNLGANSLDFFKKSGII